MSDTVNFQVDTPTLRLEGEVIEGRYKILERLGDGGMGTVYLAEHTDIRKKIAIKVLRPELVHSDDMFRRFRQEAKAASAIGHRNIVAISDFGVLPKGAPFFVMEYLEGDDLGSVLKKEGPLPWQRAFKVAVQICSALQAAHDTGILHRDVKPENFFLIEIEGEKDYVKVLDFGIAKLLGDDQSVVTRTGVFVGTPEYMSPEQAEGLELDARVDVYGVGIMLYQLLAGRVPFRGRDEFDVLNQHVSASPAPFAEVNSDASIPQDVQSVVFAALEKKREDRYQSMDEFAAALQGALDRHAAPEASASSSQASASASSSSASISRGAPVSAARSRTSAGGGGLDAKTIAIGAVVLVVVAVAVFLIVG